LDFGDRLARERRARLAAERLLEQKRSELHAANSQLSKHARTLVDQVVAQRNGLARAESEAEALRGQASRALAEIERASASALMAERRLMAALETFGDGFALFDSNLRLVVANRTYIAAFRGRVELGPGTHYDDLLRQIAASGLIDLGEMDAADWHHMMVARITRAVIDPLVVRLRPDRSIRLIDRRSQDGDLVSQAIDITETIRRETELDEARARAEAANRAKSAFLANMTHELRTPMNGVVGMAELLAESVLDADQRLYVDTIRSSGEALLAIINDVLDFSKAEAERLRLFPQAFDLERCIHEVIQLLQPAARDKGIALVVDYDIFLPTEVVADPGRVRQILTNLVGNAVKFTEAGHVAIGVAGFETAPGQFDLRLTVEDTGIGIAQDQIGHIFGEFNQVEDQANRKFEGTGLGLAITRRLVELMGGTIWVDSIPGQGSVFGFSLPVTSAEPDGAADPAPLAVRRAGIIGEGLIDRVILERQLTALGVDVAPWRTVTEACDALAVPAGDIAPGRHPGDLVFVDEDAADFAGPATAARLRAAGVAGRLVLLASASGREAEDTGPDGFDFRVAKPVRRSALFAMTRGLALPGLDAASDPPSAPAPAARRRMRVLVAEDNRTNQLVLRKMVQALAIDIEVAANGREAVEMWQRLRPDLIFMDISMPEMDGRDAARAIRKAEAETGAHVPIVALTAHAMEGDAEGILAAGIDACLTKPIRKPDIVSTILDRCPADCLPVDPTAA
jgi:hypothetical protein